MKIEFSDTGLCPYHKRMPPSSLTKQGASLVYHQFRRNCISSTQSVVYHQADEDTHLRCDDIQPKGLMRYTLTRDDIPSLVGLDKQKTLA